MTIERDPQQRVVVTGIGCVSPLGLDLESTWANAIAGRSGIGRLSKVDPNEIGISIAGELPGEPELPDIPSKEVRRMDPFVRYSTASIDQALRDSGLQIDDSNRTRVGVAIGSGIGGVKTLLDNHDALKKSGPRRVSPFTIPFCIANMSSGYASVLYGLQGPNLCHVSACASGGHAIGESAHLIARGQADVMLAGGAEAPIVGITVAGFASMKALSIRDDQPEKASRPFDLGRDGFVLAEGAGVLVLESLAHARKRGARIRAEVLGYGASADGSHIVQPLEDGSGAARCMLQAIESAGIHPSEVDYVNAHATSTPAGDPPEVRALGRVFGDHLDRLPVSATKSMTGHLLGAAGALEGILTIRALETGILPPTINLEDPDPACSLDHVAGKAREASVGMGLCNSFGFGGTNASVIYSTAVRDE